MPEGDALSFIFGGNTGLTYEELKKRRARVAAELAKQHPFPKTVGEGLTYLGNSIGDVGLRWRLEQAEKEQRALDQGLVRGAPGGAGYLAPTLERPPQGGPAQQSRPQPTLAPAPTRPASTAPRPVQTTTERAPPVAAPQAADDETMPQSRIGYPNPEYEVPYWDQSGGLPGGPSVEQSIGDEPATRLSQEQQPQSFGDRFGGVSAPREMENTAPVPYFGESTIDVPRALQNRAEPGAPDIRSQADFNEMDAAAAPAAAPRAAPPVPGRTQAPADPRFANQADYNMIDAQAGFRRPTPGYIQDAIQRNVPGDPDRQAYLGSLVGGEAPHGPRDTSSTGAAGPYQFTRGTGRQYGLMGQGGDRREDLDASTIAVNRLTDDNVRTFQRMNGRDPTPAEMAVLHQQGGVTGSRMIAGTGNAPARNLAVNNIPPNATPQQATARIQKYYGMPNEPPPGGGAPAETQVAQAPAPAQSVSQEPRAATMIGGGQQQDARAAVAAALVAQEGGPREASQAFTNPTGEVSQQNPTSAGVMPPQSPIGASPTAGSSMILAQGGSGDGSLFDPRPTAQQPSLIGGDEPPLGSALPSPRAIQPAPAEVQRGALPSADAIPPASRQERTAPGAEPVRPGLLPPNEQQRYWESILVNPRASDGVKEYAKRKIAEQEVYRKEHQAARENDFVNARTRYQEERKDYDKWVREAPDRDIKQLIDRLSIEKAQAENRKAPQDALRLQLEIDKLYKDLTSPHRVSVGGTQMEQPYTPPGQAPAPYRVSPGLPQPEEKPLTEAQAKAAEFVIRTRSDLEILRKDNGVVLSRPAEALRGNLPYIGNITATAAYREAVNASNNWGAGFLTHVSGAAVSPSEAGRNLPAFLPRAGDDAAELARKTQRRDEMTAAIGRVSGERGMAAIQAELDKQNAAYMADKPPVRVNSKEEAEQLPVGQRIILPDGRTGVVPPRRRP